MATIQYWIQIENNPWDVSPKNIDRMTGETIQQIIDKNMIFVQSTIGLVLRNIKNE